MIAIVSSDALAAGCLAMPPRADQVMTFGYFWWIVTNVRVELKIHGRNPKEFDLRSIASDDM